MNNTQSGFYAEWSREQLISELVRLNQLLKDVLEDIKQFQGGDEN